MKFPILFLLFLPLAACNLRPTIRNKNGDVVTLGNSFFSKADSESAFYEGPHGKMGYTSTKKDETVLPGQITRLKATEAALDSATTIFNSGEATKRALSSDSVKTTGIQAKQATDALKITTFPPLP